MKAGEIKRKRSGRFGSFFFGTIIGFLLTILLLVGAGAFVYFNVSAKWISTTFNANVSLGNEELDNLTLSGLVSHAMKLSQNIDTYTLNDLKNDFGVDIGDNLFGIDITDLKTVPIKQLPDELPNKLKSMSAQELNGVINLDGMSALLDKENVYYFNETDGFLYTEKDHINKVDFKYETNEEKTQIIIKNFEPFDIVNDVENPDNGKIVKIKIRFLPLSNAFSTISEITGNLTLGELRDDYGVTLPTFLDKEEYMDKKLTELSSVIDGLKLYEVLGYTKEGPEDKPVYKKDGAEVKLNEIIKKIISYAVNSLDQAFDDAIKSIKVYEAMGYTQELVGGETKYKDSEGTYVELSPFMKVVIDKQVTELNDTLGELKVFDIFERGETGLFALFTSEENPLVTDLPDAINKKINGEGETRGATIDDLIKANILPNSLAGKQIAGQPIGGLTLNEFVQKLIDSKLLTDING